MLTKGKNGTNIVPLKVGSDGTLAAATQRAEGSYSTYTDAASGVADGTYNHYYDMEGYSGIGIQSTLNNGSGTCTLTVEASLQNDGVTAQADCDYVDVTESVFGSASYTGADNPIMLLDDTGALALAKYVKVKIVTASGGADDCEYKLHVSKIK